jgi:4-diphosphocytidyl-2-C-methyl-D-erythritol kinase
MAEEERRRVLRVPDRLELTAPAKLNLCLRVLGRRDDGFHEIETLVVSLPGLADRLVIEPADRFEFAMVGVEAGEVPIDETNLVVRAVREFERAGGCTVAVRLVLEKRIPHGAGLGGGSSDAAAVLRWLGGIHGGVAAPELARIAAQIGSDVPFFLGAGPAWCRGRGERIDPAPTIPALPVLLLKPWFGVATAEAYRDWRPAPGVAGVPTGVGAPAGLPEFVNDLEGPVFAKHLFLAEVKEWLRSRPEARAAFMSGSGSTMVAVLEPAADPAVLAAAARRELDPELWCWAGWTAGVAGQTAGHC